ncbi:hypothetical protein [Puia sp.]|jgi:hypothetical protein|uniref:hypothetical protein n=1 Tax=Puia sp. TaxID=2045100 RepID=UPI002F40FCF9
MVKEWHYSLTISGDSATGKQYLRRERIIDGFWREVRKGNHILLVAPRRAGKTSMMKDLAANCPEGYTGIYEDIESIRSKEAFFQCLFELIIQSIHRGKFAKARSFLERCVKRYRIKAISKSGVSFESRDIDYESELRNMLPELKDADVHVVIFLDEFAEVIYKLKKIDRQQDAIEILHTLRQIRSDEDFKHFTVVYGGSIGLEYVIREIDRPKLINDLHPIKLSPLTPEETRQLIRQVTEKATIRISDEMINYLEEKLEYLLPYYINLTLEAVEDIAYNHHDPVVNPAFIDEAFQRVMNERKNFEDWLERLKSYHGAHFGFINSLLKHAAHQGSISIKTIYDKAVEYGRTEDYMDFTDLLVHDGYLMEAGSQTYRFTSPLLKGYWLLKYPIPYV